MERRRGRRGGWKKGKWIRVFDLSGRHDYLPSIIGFLCGQTLSILLYKGLISFLSRRRRGRGTRWIGSVLFLSFDGEAITRGKKKYLEKNVVWRCYIRWKIRLENFRKVLEKRRILNKTCNFVLRWQLDDIYLISYNDNNDNVTHYSTIVNYNKCYLIWYSPWPTLPRIYRLIIN